MGSVTSPPSVQTTGHGPQATGARQRSPAWVVLAMLVAGLAIGAFIKSGANPDIIAAAGKFELIGTVWINAIRMTVVPLVAALTIASVATSGDAASLGRTGGYAVLTFALLLLAGGYFTMLVAPLGLNGLDIPPDVAAELRATVGGAGAGAPALQMPSLAQRIVDMVPVNPIAAAASGAILPVVVFSLALGLALTRVAPEKREPFIEVCRAISDALLVLVQWILKLAPIGVFALALGLGVKMGASSAAALFRYTVTLCAALFAFTLLLYPIVAIFGRISIVKFATAALPAQAVGFSVRSSLAALPAMITAVRDTLGLSPRASGFTLPLAVSIFRVNVPIAWVVGLIFLGKLYGVPMPIGSLAVLVITATLISFSVPGLPSASLFLLSPVLVQHGLPAESVGMLIALDAIPDMFKTLANVTAHLTSAVIVSRTDTSAGAAVLSRGAEPHGL
jgi:proton glutamate symport protein